MDGTLLGRMHHSIYKSSDTGLTFVPIVKPPDPVFDVYGGALAGECMIFNYTELNGISQHSWISKSTDNGITQTLIKDSVALIFSGHIGTESGELYADELIKGDYYLCHSTDFGASFDTLAYDPSIFKLSGRKFAKLSTGAKKGELYLVSSSNTCPLNYITIYRSVDYGHTWIPKSEKTFDCQDLVRYCGGRAEGTFYILHETSAPLAQFLDIEVFASTDSGQTFNVYNHRLAHSLAVPHKEDVPVLAVWPNPVTDAINIQYKASDNGKAAISLKTIDGKRIGEIASANFMAGSHLVSYDCQNLKPGMYLIFLKQENGHEESTIFLKK
jgi:hypothetical protein